MVRRGGLELACRREAAEAPLIEPLAAQPDTPRKLTGPGTHRIQQFRHGASLQDVPGCSGAERLRRQVRALVHGETKRYPFGCSVKVASPNQYPAKAEILDYFCEVREISRRRLEETTESDFERAVHDDHYGQLTVSQVWGGVITSFAWHAGQIAQTNRLLGRA